jgi:acetylglutamate kinase
MESLIAKAKVLMEALPYIRTFAGATVVVKYGGAAMTEEALKASFAADMVLLRFIGLKPVVVHGGGPMIGEMMKRLGKEPAFVGGRRVTDAETMGIVEMVLSGTINKEIVSLIAQAGGKGIGLSGRDAGMLTAEQAPPEAGMDMGRVGRITAVDPVAVSLLTTEGFIPIIAPVAVDAAGEALNVNADEAAGALAGALSAAKLFFLTDTPGILDASGKKISSLTVAEAGEKIRSGEITGGMIPKVESAVAAVHAGVGKVHVVDGRLQHAVLLEIFTERGVGTQIVAG